MGKLLRVMVVFLFLFSIGTLVLGILLFNKRELLKGRTQKLEEFVMKLGPTIEKEPAAAEQNEFPSRDTDQCTPELVQQPQRSPFWTTYKLQLEKTENATLDLRPKLKDLMTYYKIDPITGKPMVEPTTGFKVTKGEGTMQAVIDFVIQKNTEQLQRMNETRDQLKTLREELINTIEELNKRKGELRQALNTIVQRDQTIAQLEEKVRGLEAKIRQLETDIQGLKDEIAQLNDEKAKMQEEIERRDETIKVLERKLKEYTERRPNTRPEDATSTAGGVQIVAKIVGGEKGVVTAVNPAWRFVILELTDQFIAEVTGNDPTQPPALPVELYIKRKGAKDEFVTKIRLVQIRQDQKMGIADILDDWQQLPAQAGDVVFY